MPEVQRGAAIARNDDAGEEADRHADHGHLRTGEAAGGDLGGERHQAEHRRRGQHHQQGAMHGVFCYCHSLGE